jgi:outer membrane receptor protein involved in Fe transport
MFIFPKHQSVSGRSSSQSKSQLIQSAYVGKCYFLSQKYLLRKGNESRYYRCKRRRHHFSERTSGNTDKIITDVSLAYQFTKNIGLTVGVNNLFDIYPTKNLPASSNNDQFIYSRSTSQFGQNGRFVFSRLNFNF